MSNIPDSPKPAATEPAAPSMEDLQKATGGCGRFQWMLVLSVRLGVIPMGWSMLQMAFSGIVPDWWCLADSPGNFSGSLSSSNGYHGNWSRDNATFQSCEIPGSPGESCAGHMVFDDSIATVVSEWSLVCDWKHIKPLMTTVQMAGVFVGALVAGQTADALGRRVTAYGALLWHLVTSLVAAFSVNWQMFMAMRALIGMAIGAYLVVNIPYSFEFVPSQHRQMVAFTPTWNVGISLLALGAWLMPHWSHLQIAVAAITVPCLLTWFIVPESVRWLATKDRLQEAERVVQRVARVNRRDMPRDTMLTLQHVALGEKKVGQGRRYTYLDIFRGWRMALTTFICTFVWFSMSLSYYGISFGVSALSGNFYLNLFLMNIVEIPVKFFMVFVANKLGRRWTCFGLYTLGSLSSFGILLVHKIVSEDSQGSAITALAMVSKMCVGTGWTISVSLVAESYPTVVRSLGYGASNMMARVGGAVAPLALNMDTADDVARAYAIVGSVMAASGVFILVLRETKGQGLQDSITIKPKKTETELPVWTVEGEKRMDEKKGNNKEGKEGREKTKDVKEMNGTAVESTQYLSVRL